MNSDISFRVNSPNVVADIIDGEAVVVNLGLGLYYSLDRVGAVIWDFVEKGHTIADMSQALQTIYQIDAETVDKTLSALLEELVNEQLLTPQPNSSSKPISGLDAVKKVGTFSPPELLKYDDMEELLQLDPIHDVDDLGWPVVKADTD